MKEVKTYEIKTLKGWKTVNHEDYWHRIMHIVNNSPMCHDENSAIELITKFTRVDLSAALASWTQESWAALMYEWAKN